jgi:hypothetical protein
MRVLRPLLVLLVPALLVPAFAAGPAPAAPVPTLVAIRAAHHPGFDRVVFEFRGGLPATRRTKYVDRLLGDASGLPIRIAGQAVLQVTFEAAKAHDAQGSTAPARKAFALPNVMTTVRSGDFESVTTYGIGLAKKSTVRVSTLRSPARVVVDIGAAFRTVNRRVFFVDSDRVTANLDPFVTGKVRPVRPLSPARGLMDRLFAEPTPGERAAGLILVRSGASGYAGLSIADGLARVRLTGGCSSGGSTVTIADEIMPTLRALASVRWVKILGPGGRTERPNGHTDSIPACLEP